MESCFRVGLSALPLCGAAVTFFAAAKKVTKESSFSYRPRSHARWPFFSSSMAPRSECPHSPHRAWHAHGLPPRIFERAGSAPKSFGTALRAAVGYARETNVLRMQRDGDVSKDVRADPIDRSAAKRAGTWWGCTSPLNGAMSQWVREPSPVDLRGHSLLPGH